MTTTPKISKELSQSVADYLVAKAWVETIKPVIDKIHQDWLDSNKPKAAQEWGADQVITRPFDTYLMEEEQFLTYLTDTAKAKREAGFEVKDDDICPLGVAEHNVIKAEWRMLKHSECLTGVKDIHFTSMDKREEFIDLTVKAVNSAPKQLFA